MKITSQPAKDAIFVDYQRLTMMVGACYPVLSFFLMIYPDLSGCARDLHIWRYAEVFQGFWANE